jgi:G3E family GTPase
VDRANDKFVGRLVRKQLVGADLLVLNKIDLVDSTQLSAAKALVAREASGVSVVEMCHADVDPSLFLEWTGSSKSGFVCEAPDENSNVRFESHHWVTEGIVNLRKLTDAIAALDPSIIRVKGLITHQGQDWEVHRVGNRTSVEPLTGAAYSTRTELTFIAQQNGLDRSRINSILNSCISSEGSQHNA